MKINSFYICLVSSNEDKRNNFEREFLSFGKRASNLAPADMERNFMSFGKRALDNVFNFK